MADLARRFPAPHRFAIVDVVHDDQVTQWAEDVLAACGAPDISINNAAPMNRPAPLWEVPRRSSPA